MKKESDKMKNMLLNILIVFIIILFIGLFVVELNDAYNRGYRVGYNDGNVLTNEPINDDLYLGSVIPINKEVYLDEWILIFDDDSQYDKYNTKLITGNYTNSTVLIQLQFEYVGADLPLNAYIYYNKSINNTGWYTPTYNYRRSINWSWNYTAYNNTLDELKDTGKWKQIN